MSQEICSNEPKIESVFNKKKNEDILRKSNINYSKKGNLCCFL